MDQSEGGEEKPDKKKRPGRKPKFEQLTAYQDGAPRLTTRVDPDVLEWAKSRPEGLRSYVERLIRTDREQESPDVK